MIIWRGIGIVTPVLLFGGLIASQLIADSLGGEGTYTRNALLWGGLGAVAGGAITYLVGRWDESRNPTRTLVDPTTGKEKVLRSRSDLFFIPMKYWGMAAVLLGAIALVVGPFV